ncbi:MAG TPA: 16S rRNA (cytosine(1402)-N(4))-methyltransferase RsmH, partial [Anaerolineaceae bacterium]|nr:16S rRNA (cytosine(1402)-N(4))-methyltransferase RsmH [Anaerolineaceae bacterium]
ESPGFYVDGTVGAGGHAWGILESSSPEGHLLGLDLDPQALELAGQRLAPFGNRAILRPASYTSLQRQIRDLGWPPVNGIVVDLGVSSMQLDTAERGFSFQSDGPLDMRFSPNNPTRAADLVNGLPENELADIIWQYGEDRFARRIARAIVQARPLQTTRQLAEVIARASGKHSGHIHPATRTFQALRIVVNQELQSIEAFLPQAVDSLAPGGRLAVIAFHSIEDRLVKQYFRRESQDCICPPEQPVCTCNHHAVIREVNRHPIQPTEEEKERNSRARSARLRVAEKLPLA